MGITERREREKEEIRHKILDAARELFAAEGYEKVTMRRIAEAIEYSPTAIYLHFKDKDDLVRALCDADFGRLLEAMQHRAGVGRPDRGDPAARPRLRRLRPRAPEPLPLHVHDAGPAKDETARGRATPGDRPSASCSTGERGDRGGPAPRDRPADASPRCLWMGVHGVASALTRCPRRALAARPGGARPRRPGDRERPAAASSPIREGLRPWSPSPAGTSSTTGCAS